MPPRSAEAVEAAVAATGLLGLPTGGPCSNSGDERAPGGPCGNSGDEAARGRLLLSCSAGRDSACLMDLAVRLLGPGAVRVLHVDHGLRAESGVEAEKVRSMAEALGVECVVMRAGAPPRSGNLHAWARGERARLAGETARGLEVSAIATAHTRTDLVETALFRLATQPGRRALLAMRPAEPWTFGDAGDRRDLVLVRPLLGISRDETLAYCVERGLRWKDDPSNADRQYARARLRHSVTPVLRGLNPRFEETALQTLRELEDEREVLDALVVQALPPGADAIAVEALAALPRPLGRLVLRELCERSAGRPVARAAARLDEILRRALADRAPFALDVGDGVRVSVRRGLLAAGPSDGPAAPTPSSLR